MFLNFLNAKDLEGSLFGARLDGLDFDLRQAYTTIVCQGFAKITQLDFLKEYFANYIKTGVHPIRISKMGKVGDV